MNRYELLVIVGDQTESRTVFAERFSAQTTSSASSGFYAFYADRKLVACYPICRTIITSIEEAEE